MKIRAAVGLAMVVASSVVTAGSSFNSGTGILVIPDVAVDGAAFFDSVSLRLDLATGQFAIVSATPKNTKVSDVPLQSYENGGIKVGFLGCYRSGTNQITCYTQVINTNNDANISFVPADFNPTDNGVGNMTTRLFDNLGNPYTGSIAVFGKSSTSRVEGTVLQGVPVRVAYTYTNVDSRATSIAAFAPSYYYHSARITVSPNFKSISF